MPQPVGKLTGGEPVRSAQSIASLRSSRRRTFSGLITIIRLASLLGILLLGISSFQIASAEEKGHQREAELISKENSVDTSRPPGEWRPATVGQELIVHDRLRTGEDSRAAVQFGDSSVLRIDELTEEEILPPQVANSKPTLNLKQGSAYFFSREKAREIHVQTPAANGAIRGTEFVVAVAADGSTTFTIIDGEVEISNSQGSVLAQSGERAEIQPSGGPTKAEVTDAIDSAQWCFYYPGVLDLNDLALSPSEQDALRGSLSAYAQGDILRALEEHPHNHAPVSLGEKVYRAGLFLVAGQIQKAQALLQDVNQDAPGRQALSTLIAAVTLKEKSTSAPPQTATDWVAESYYRQSKADLPGALQAAQRATNLDANFGFAWTRVAESEFNLGRVPEAKEALEKGLKLAPRNPPAHALRGFVLSAENNLMDAKHSFETAIALDSALGDGWLGRGLCLIKQGHVEAGRRDLLVAAALEPNRAIFRRYLSDYFSALDSGATTAKKRTSSGERTAAPKRGSAQAVPTLGAGGVTGGTEPVLPPRLGLPIVGVGVASGGGQAVPTPTASLPLPTPTPRLPLPTPMPSPSTPGVGVLSAGGQPAPSPTRGPSIPSAGVALEGAKASPTPTPSTPQIARKKAGPEPRRTPTPTPPSSRVSRKKATKGAELTAAPRPRRTPPSPRPTRPQYQYPHPSATPRPTRHGKSERRSSVPPPFH